MILTYSLGFALLSGLGSVLLAAVFLATPDATRRKVLSGMISYATGCLLGAAFLGMLPHALSALPIKTASATVMSGIVLFFLLEKLVVWRHCHREHCSVHPATGWLILIGDGLHNFLDGVAIVAAFQVSVPLGVAAAVSIAAHEIPQEVGDFAILLASGYSRAWAFRANVICSLTAVAGVLVGYFLLNLVGAALPYFMGVAAAGFIWIAVADLLPSLRQTGGTGAIALQVLLLIAGIATINLFHIGH